MSGVWVVMFLLGTEHSSFLEYDYTGHDAPSSDCELYLWGEW